MAIYWFESHLNCKSIFLELRKHTYKKLPKIAPLITNLNKSAA